MLAALSIRNFVLIDRLDIEFGDGLCVLTGETGAGKSILLDALGLAIGARADASAVRAGDDSAERTSISATFELSSDHAVFERLAELDVDPAPADEGLVLRRTMNADGRSRAYVNDQPVSIGALRRIGERLVEIEGQFASHGLLDPASHRASLDAFGGHGDLLDKTRAAWDTLRETDRALADAREEIERISDESEYLRHVHAELAEIDPQPDEEATLAETRAVMVNSGKIAEAVDEGLSALTADDGVQTRLARAMRVLERANEQGAGFLKETLEAIDRTADEAAAAADLLTDARARIDLDPAGLEQLEDRLFALRALARKHGTDVDSLAALRERFAEKLEKLDGSARDIADLERRAAEAREVYDREAGALSRARASAADALDGEIAGELPHLRLEKAQFTTDISADDTGGPDGIDRVRFEVAANPGQPPGPVDKVASGGELARLLLALKVVLSRANRTDTLVFDEVDAGVGGATAAAVAERLFRLADGAQVLVVTHSPQVAARGVTHFRVEKSVSRQNGTENAVTAITALTADDRREEIARMLAGATVTDEARAAADSLIAGTGS